MVPGILGAQISFDELMAPQNVNVTFRVDMSQMTVSQLGVHIAGTFNSWDPGSTLMTETDSAVYEVTLFLPAGDSVEFKYINGNAWGMDETVPVECGVDNGYGGYNRYAIPVTDTILPLVCFSQCDSCQNLTLDLTFTAVNNETYIQLDSIKVMNRTQGGETVIYWPDTSLTLEITQGDLLLYIGYSAGYPVGVQEINQEMNQFQLFQNYPNPVKDQTMVSLYIQENGPVTIMVTDLPGKVLINSGWQLEKGYHSFRFTPGKGRFLLITAKWNGISRGIKVLSEVAASGKRSSLEYIGSNDGEFQIKASTVTQNLTQESGILDTPESNESYTFQFTTNIHCPGTPTVTYEGQEYSTIQIYSLCWLKENLNVGTMINGNQNPQNNGIIEKYCYDNNPSNCNTYGGMYRWNEMMQYTTQPGTQGICPPDWHLPADEEWKVLEGAVDSQYGIGDPEWDRVLAERGFDAGTNLKTTYGWNDGGNGTDLYGFSALPGGYSPGANYFMGIGHVGSFLTSSESNATEVFNRALSKFNPTVYRQGLYKQYNISVRCVRDY